jgi:A/G-specific adenine glycosylase
LRSGWTLRYEQAVTPDVARIRRRLLAWYRRGHRDLPWRRARDPYATWVSEIMLQQTRVEAVVPYFQRWMARFPTVRALADAPLDDVLAHWAGLGYYARARNLHAAAHAIVAQHGGRFPDDPVAVRALPGIGRYTAGAILSIAFGRAEPICDGNVARVLARVCAVPGAVDERATQNRLWELAAELVPNSRAAGGAGSANNAGDFNQALMELGATVCTPRAPACPVCPLRAHCAAHARGDAEAFPRPKTRRPPRAVEQVALWLERRGCVLLVRRPARGLWGGLWEPPTGERAATEPPEAAARRVARARIGLSLSRIEAVTQFEHVLSHRLMRFHVFRARAAGQLALDGYDAARWTPHTAAAEIGVAAWTSRLFATIDARSRA